VKGSRADEATLANFESAGGRMFRDFRGGSAARVPVGERDARDAARRPYWLIRRSNGGNIEAFTVEVGGLKALPVFSFEEEAELFLALGVSEDGWKVGRSGAGEILSILHGPLSDAVGIVLDPVPESCGGSLLKLLTIERTEFEEAVLGSSFVTRFSSKASLPA
jgi:hypothetical protein